MHAITSFAPMLALDAWWYTDLGTPGQPGLVATSYGPEVLIGWLVHLGLAACIHSTTLPPKKLGL